MAGDLPTLTGVHERMASFGALLAASRRAADRIRKEGDVADFLAEREERCLALRAALLDGSWRPGAMRVFHIRRPKPRTIAVAPFADRVVHHALCAELLPLFDAAADPDSFACHVGRGPQRAVRRVQRLARASPWWDCQPAVAPP